MSIKEHQNDEYILKLQYTARFLYNTAEVTEHLLWIVCFSSILCGFYLHDKIAVYVSTALIIIDFILASVESLCVKYSAIIRNYVDECLFSLDVIRNDNQERILSVIESCVEKLRKRTMLKQITQSGTDTVKGVRDWYNIDDALDDDTIIHNCQSQNIGFDKIVSTITSVLGTIVIFVSIAFIIKFGFELWVILSFCPAFFMGVKTIFCILKAHKYIISAQSLNEMYEKTSDKRTVLIETQQVIMKRRSVLYVPSSLIYKLVSKMLHGYFKY